MADIDITKNHTLGKEGARTAANGVIDRMKSSMGLQGAWNGDVYDFSKPAKGKFTVTDTTVRVEIELGFAMRMMKGTIEERVRGELDKSLK